MRTDPANARAWALGLAAIAAAACVPRGDPPSGRQVIAGRESQLAAIAPPNGDGVLRVLVLRPTADGMRDLYVVPVDAAGEPGTESLLATGLDPTTDLGCIHRLAPCSFTPNGWTFLNTNGGYVGVNVITGARMVLDSFSQPVFSASGQRLFLTNYDGAMPTAQAMLTGPDGTVTTFDIAVHNGLGSVGGTYSFFGEDFYYLTPQSELMHIPPSGGQEQLATSVAGFDGFLTPDGVMLLLVRTPSDPNVYEVSVRDPVTGLETVLPLSDSHVWLGDIQAPTDGRWLLVTDSVGRRFVFVDARTGAQQTIAFPDDFAQPAFPGDTPEAFGYTRRPATFQIWLTAGASDTPTILVLSADAPPVAVPGLTLSGFTDDGAFWFSTATGPDQALKVLQVGAADDPTGPRRLLAPAGTYVDWSLTLADGRLLMAVYAKDEDRSDLIATDLATGDDRLLGERGRVAALGDTRVLGLFHFDSGAGDLTAVDIGSGQQTILAPEFAVTAFAEPQGPDLVAPGTRVVYEFEARSPSPYDGVWVVNVP